MQQETLSIRVPAALRSSLERTRELISSHNHKSTSTSDVAKLLLQSAIEHRLDEQLEVGDLLANPTQALWAIRRKWEVDRDLSRAEWLLLAYYVQIGCEDMGDDYGLPRPESFAQTLEASLAVRGLRVQPEMGRLDRYYWQNLASGPLRQVGLDDPDVVMKAFGSVSRSLRESTSAGKPVFVGRCLFVAVRDERVEGIASLNRALFPYLPVLYGLAARGHYLRERPVRAGSAQNRLVSRFASSVISADHCVSTLVTNDGELEMLIEIRSKQMVYPLGPFPLIREFGSLLERLEFGRLWNGREFSDTPAA